MYKSFFILTIIEKQAFLKNENSNNPNNASDCISEAMTHSLKDKRYYVSEYLKNPSSYAQKAQKDDNSDDNKEYFHVIFLFCAR